MKTLQLSYIKRLKHLFIMLILPVFCIGCCNNNTLYSSSGIYVLNKAENTHDTLFLNKDWMFTHHLWDNKGRLLLNYTDSWSIKDGNEIVLNSYYYHCDEITVYEHFSHNNFFKGETHGSFGTALFCNKFPLNIDAGIYYERMDKFSFFN